MQCIAVLRPLDSVTATLPCNTISAHELYNLFLKKDKWRTEVNTHSTQTQQEESQSVSQAYQENMIYTDQPVKNYKIENVKLYVYINKTLLKNLKMKINLTKIK